MLHNPNNFCVLVMVTKKLCHTTTTTPYLGMFLTIGSDACRSANPLSNLVISGGRAVPGQRAPLPVAVASRVAL